MEIQAQEGMNRMIRILLACALLSLTSSVWADIELGIAEYNEGNYATALAEFQEASDSGDPFGDHLLASLYYQGHGVKKDIAKAVELFERAASQGYPASHANLGLMYQNGDGVQADSKKALFHYSEAAKMGDYQSSFRLGQIYRTGWLDIKPSAEKAVALYRIGAVYGHVPSVNEFALMFAQGMGVPNDFVESYAWMQYAAAQKDPSATKNLAQLTKILKEQGNFEAAKERAVSVNELIAANLAEAF